MKRLLVLGFILLSGAVTFSASVVKVRHIKKSPTSVEKPHIQPSEPGVKNVNGRHSTQTTGTGDIPTYFIPHQAAFIILE